MTIDFNNTKLEIRKKLASSEDIPADILEKLSKDFNAEVRQAVASNPNTPTETLFALGQEFPNEFLNNPIFSLFFLENPSFVTEIPLATLRSLIKQDNVPESFIVDCATRESDRNMLLSITAKLKTSTNVLEKLIQSKFPEGLSRTYGDNKILYFVGWVRRGDDFEEKPITFYPHRNPPTSIL